MKRLPFLLLLVAGASFHPFAQTKITPSKPTTASLQTNQLIGTWRLIEFADRDSENTTWTYPYGKYPKGYFTYTKNGIVNLNISSETPLKISRDSAKYHEVNLLNWIDHHSEGYFGTYSVDFKNSIVTHHVTGGSLPWYIDTDQQRPFVLKGDTLIIGDSKTWKRILVKED